MWTADFTFRVYKAMTKTIFIQNQKIPLHTFHTVIVGTGAAGYNAADTLYDLHVRDIAIITEGKNMGTSRNTGSDKQTYYKLTVAGDRPDSVSDMAKNLFEGGSMHGDIALAQAAGSTAAFYKLIGLGVPFPHNEYGEYVGYKTDHDPRMRATSCGPLTSRYMTEALEKSVASKGIPLFDRQRVIRILTQKEQVIGLVCLSLDLQSEENPFGLSVFYAQNIVWATGGPSAIYASSVYPESQTCAHGVAFEAGAAGINLTESQYGIASLSFRWNLSGTYQQVIPRYISTDKNGNDEKEFLDAYFPTPSAMLGAIFLKGYEWPFDPRKLGMGSSVVDIAIFKERQAGRRVWLDYSRNPSAAEKDGGFDFSLLPEVALSYLSKSGALLPTPIERLLHMNKPAVDLYVRNGIILAKEKLEIDVCAQHNNGGLDTDIWSESTTLSHFFPVGECAGTFGVYRPGGTALNATQVGSARAAERIASRHEEIPEATAEDWEKQIAPVLSLLETLSSPRKQSPSLADILNKRLEYGKRMSECGAFIRSLTKEKAARQEVVAALQTFEKDYAGTPPSLLHEVLINRDVLITQQVYLSALIAYTENGGRSRGSYLIAEEQGDLPALPKPDKSHAGFAETSLLLPNGTVSCSFVPVRPIPERELWFENVYNQANNH